MNSSFTSGLPRRATCTQSPVCSGGAPLRRTVMLRRLAVDQKPTSRFGSLAAGAVAVPESPTARLAVRLVRREERERWRELMRKHHYLGLQHIVGESLCYVATSNEEWVALLGWGAIPPLAKPSRLPPSAWSNSAWPKPPRTRSRPRSRSIQVVQRAGSLEPALRIFGKENPQACDTLSRL